MEDEKIKQNMNDIRDNTYGKKLDNKSSAYITGAIVGGTVGLLAGWYFKGNMLVYGIGGAVIFGYVGYKVSEGSEPKVKFVNKTSS